jgi:outer membrane lipoprotein-sorting protein
MTASAQEPTRQKVSEAEKANLLKQLGKRVESFSCHFIEEKWIAVLDETVVSKGIIQYESPNRLVCEYTEPESIVLSKNSDGSLTVTKNGKNIPASMMYKQMMEMMSAFVSGEAVSKSDDYNAEVFSEENGYIISLTPKTKGRFSVIELYIDPNNKRIQKTVLKEAKGDRTTITMMD